MKRQAIQVSINELEDLIKALQKEKLELNKETRIKYSNDKKFQVNIINKRPRCSDTWEFEDCACALPSSQTMEAIKESDGAKMKKTC